jgi:Lar family restriction alleviation protein
MSDQDATAVTQAREELDMDTLKPCPFCGFEARIIEVEETDNRGGFVVCCTGCEASTKVWFPLKDDVTQILRDEWNKRAAALSDAQQQERRTMVRCGLCHTWNSKPCGEQCAWDPQGTERMML